MNSDLHNLIVVTEQLAQSGISYSLGGSGLLLSLGLTNAVGDWDVMVETSKELVMKALSINHIEEIACGDFPFGTAYKLVIHFQKGPQVEILGRLSIHSNKGLCQMPSIPSSIWNGIQVGSPEVWYVAYALMDRTQKADILLSYLKEVGANQRIISILMDEPLPVEIMEVMASLKVN